MLRRIRPSRRCTYWGFCRICGLKNDPAETTPPGDFGGRFWRLNRKYPDQMLPLLLAKLLSVGMCTG